MNTILTTFRERAKAVNWLLLVALLLLLNVKLVVKLAAFLIIFIYRYRRVEWKTLHRQKHLYFYFAVILIGLINYLLSQKQGMSQFVATGLGIFLWLVCLAATYYLYRIVQQEEITRLFNTISLFFILHICTVFFNLAGIMIECGTLNPYTFKGFHQKYYISTGDYITGITMDSPVTTAMISAFALIYFLYRRQFVFSLLSMAAMVLIASNLTNVMLVAVLLFLFVFRTDRVQKSVIILQFLVLIIFIGKISPQNNEYTGRFAYKIFGLTYDKPKKNISADFIRKQPDSSLSETDKMKKFALLYIDSISTIRASLYPDNRSPGDGYAENKLPDKKILKPHPVQTAATQFRETGAVKEKVHRYTDFLDRSYSPRLQDSLRTGIDAGKPGKWVSVKQVFSYFREHPAKILLGAGTGNFSSRLAFKTTALGIAGGYPEKYRYIHPDFHDNHLYLYLWYHAQDQPKHAAENTPDSTYGQLISEYGIAGILAFVAFFVGYFMRGRRLLSFGIGIGLLLAGAFLAEYWFEQLSIVVLAELMLFTDIKSGVLNIEK